MIRHCRMGTTRFRFRSTCRKCGERITEFHGLDAPLRLRHLPLFEVPVYLELRPKRYRCRRCEGSPTTTEQPSWYQRRSPNTTAYEQWLLRILINSTVSDVSHKLQVSAATVTGMLERWIETSVNWDAFSAIAVIGIDEISLKRGHRDFVAIITTKTALGVQVLAVLQNIINFGFMATFGEAARMKGVPYRPAS
jgi:transposase